MMSHWISTMFGAISAAGIGILTYAAIPERPFMEIGSMEIYEGQVFIESAINGPEVVADWTVTVVGNMGDAPSCHTTPGPELHQGWSRYAPRKATKRSFSLDVWVADARGCYSRLPPGDYTMHVTWTPRDGRAPVTEQDTFSIPETPEGGV